MAAAGERGLAKDIVATVADQADQISHRLRDGGLDRTLEDARRARPATAPACSSPVPPSAGFVAARVARIVDTGSLKEAAAPARRTNGARARRLGHPIRSGAGSRHRHWRPTASLPRCDRAPTLSASPSRAPVTPIPPSRSTPTSRSASSSAA